MYQDMMYTTKKDNGMLQVAMDYFFGDEEVDETGQKNFKLVSDMTKEL